MSKPKPKTCAEYWLPGQGPLPTDAIDKAQGIADRDLRKALKSLRALLDYSTSDVVWGLVKACETTIELTADYLSAGPIVLSPEPCKACGSTPGNSPLIVDWLDATKRYLTEVIEPGDSDDSDDQQLILVECRKVLAAVTEASSKVQAVWPPC